MIFATGHQSHQSELKQIGSAEADFARLATIRQGCIEALVQGFECAAPTHVRNGSAQASHGGDFSVVVELNGTVKTVADIGRIFCCFLSGASSILPIDNVFFRFKLTDYIDLCPTKKPHSLNCPQKARHFLGAVL